MRWLVDFSLKFRLMIVALAAGMLLLGVSQVRSMPVDVLPEFDPPFVEIQTEALGLSAEEVAQLITVPLEQDLLNGVAWIESLQSESVPGLSSITLTFRPGTDLYRARQMVGERLTQAFALPHVSKPPTMMQPSSSTSRVMMVGLSSTTVSPIDLSVLARWTVAPRLMGVPGVSNVAIWGQRDRQLQVLVDPERLRDNRVTLLQVMETTGNAMWVSSLSWLEASTPGSGGFVETSPQRLGIRHVFPITSASDLAQVPLEGSLLKLGEVTTVVEDHQPLIGDAVGNADASLLLVVEKLPGANTLAVTRGVESALTAMQPGMPGVEINSSIYRPATYIEQSIRDISWVLVAAYLLTALVLGVFLFEWRRVVISLVAIPLALLAGMLVLHLRDASMNALVAAGLAVAVGVVVHDAILSVGAVARRLEEPRPEDAGHPKAAIIAEAATDGRRPLVYATLIMLLAVLPVFLIGGAPGAFFLPLAASYGLAVMASMLVALTVTPALCMLLLGPAVEERPAPPHLRWLRRAYEAALLPTLRRPVAVLALAGALALAGLIGLPFLAPSLMPTFREPNVLIHLDLPPGASEPEMNRITARVRDELQALPGVRNVGAHVGRAVLSDKVNHVHSSEVWVTIDPSAPYDATLTAIEQIVAGYPGVSHSVRSYLAERMARVSPAADDAITVRVFGDNVDRLRASAEDVRRAVAGVTGVAAAQVVAPVEEPTLHIQVDLAAAQRYGLKPGDVRRQAATLVSGIQVGSLFDAQKVFDVVVWGTPEVRGSLESVRNLLLDTPTGTQVRLGDVAQASIAPDPAVVRHDSARGYLDVRADVAGRPLDAVAADIEQRVQGVQFPLEYHAEVLGTYAQRQLVQSQLLGLAVAVVLGMYLLLQAALGSWRLAALALVTLVSALAGGVLVALAEGSGLSLGAVLALLAVFGLAVRAIIVQIDRYQHMERAAGQALRAEVVRAGVHEGAVPLLATTLALALALGSLAIAGDLPGLEMLRSMAGVALGALLTSTLVTLFVVPCLYLRFGTSPEPAEAALGYPRPLMPPLAVDGQVPAGAGGD